MPKLVPIKPGRFIKILEKLGFMQRDAQGSHVFFKHTDRRTTVVPMLYLFIPRKLVKGFCGKF